MPSSPKKPKSSELILLPRGYLSSSALDLWLSSPKQYEKKYFEGKDIDRPNEYMSFGKRLAQHLETGDFEDDAMVIFAKNFLPSFGNNEYELTTVLKTAYGDIKLLGKLDDFNPTENEIYEHKTGKTVWTQHRVNNHGQLKFYAVMRHNDTGEIPRQILHWIETVSVGGTVRPTGKVERFEYLATLEEIEEKKREIINACIEIDIAYRRYLKRIENA